MNMTDLDMAYLSPTEKCDMCGESKEKHNRFYHPFRNAFVDDRDKTPKHFPTYLNQYNPYHPQLPDGCNGNWSHYPEEYIKDTSGDVAQEFQCNMRRQSIAKYKEDQKRHAHCGWLPFEELKTKPISGRCEDCYPPKSNRTERASCLCPNCRR